MGSNLFSTFTSDLAISGKTRMVAQGRSEGDGMENVISTVEVTTPPSHKQIDTRLIQTCSSNFGRTNIKRKEPKFVPYEPYKAAVSPILPMPEKNAVQSQVLSKSTIDPSLKKPVKTSKVIKNGSLKEVKAVPKNEIGSLELSSKQKEAKLVDSRIPSLCHKCKFGINSPVSMDNVTLSWANEKEDLNKRIEELIKEKDELAAQFNVQTKVNADLKKLLVASLGEDMQTKVQYMSEDKAKLGEHVLLYSKQLMQTNEEVDKLSLECDLWKKKFEASSLLVKELAGWKTVLSRKFDQANGAINCLLNEQKETSEQLSSIFKSLQCIQAAFDPTSKLNYPCAENPWNVLQLASATRSLSEDIKVHLLGSSFPSAEEEKSSIYAGKTVGEEAAIEVITDAKNLQNLAKSEVSRFDEMGAGSQACSVLPHVCSREPTVNCCKHCSGEIKVL